jgi:hypothetical protein
MLPGGEPPTFGFTVTRTERLPAPNGESSGPFDVTFIFYGIK